MNKKKMKQALALLCAGAMTVTGMNLPVNVLSIKAVEQVQNESSGETSDVTSDSIITQTGWKEIDSTILAKNAKANSEQNPSSGTDGPAAWAFDDENHWWHSRWSGTAQQGEDREDGRLDNVEKDGPVWIQTGFDVTKKVERVTYQSRGGGLGHAKKYEIKLANTPGEEPGENDWETVAEGTFENGNDTEKEIILTEAKDATHIQFLVYSVYGGEAQNNNFVSAKRIRVFEKGEVQYDMNKQEDFWEYELANGNLAEQTEEDRWHYQIKENNVWSDLPQNAYKVNAGVWMNSGVQDATYHWAKLGKNEITSTLQRQQAVAFSWKANRAGYYKATLEENIGDGGPNKLNIIVGHAIDGETGDGEELLSGEYGKGEKFTSKIARVSDGDLIRIGATVDNAWAQGFLPMVEEVTAKDYAEQYLAEVTDVENQGVYTEESKKAVVDAKAALQTAVDATEPDMQEIEAKIVALEQAIQNLQDLGAVLEEAIDAADAIINEADYEQKYTEASQRVLEEALQDAIDAQSAEDMQAGELQVVIDALNYALANLEMKFVVTINNNGTTETKNCDPEERVTVVAETAPEGKQFAYWTVDGTPIGYKETYTFTVLSDVTVVAVYVDASSQVEKPVSVMCNVTYDNGRVKLVSKHSVPADQGYKVLKTGIVATDSTGYKAIQDADAELNLDTTATTRLKKYGVETDAFLANFTQYIKTSRATTWYAKGYVTYEDAQGTQRTVYSDVAQYTIQ